MIYLLDANTLIRANADYYPIERIPQFWDWLIGCGQTGLVKIPNEIADEVTAGRDDVADWLKEAEAKNALRLSERVDITALRHVVATGYAPDLDSTEMQKIGKDPFLIAYALGKPDRRVVTKEQSKPSKIRSNRKVPDVCDACGVTWLNDFGFYREADFRIC
ncbi:DUF4411 family protein [Rhodobacter capsulatus]|uniref:DUF4411 family protein n=1 Tax=Rhodobacter capsulatus (strain ATCC BAA-309 / NBRC 16581 / SB1003) TaxID=272942 RepID=D5APU5_RHOCB|nr:DUF4411 family protein [Rhodobacter capsulatus]ADE86664.1 conserved hypothetical protein [Rhodobacter capsulatus SB 1003]MDS0928465.1 DUF4411 family protein [Rhodobacter capsulatus]